MLPALVLALALQAAPPQPLTWTAETTHFQRTGRYEEAVQLCHAFQKRYPRKARCTQFGTTPEGRPLLALAVSSNGVLDAKAARNQQRPVVLFQGGIHAGEIDGKDAGFWLLRDALDGKALDGVLGKVTAVFVPVFNVDGHERFGPNQRPNQVGPEEMGWRVTAQNYNLNRDYMKVDAPEMTAMLGLLNEWDPLVYLDLHVTDGAQFQPDVAVIIQGETGQPELEAAAARLTVQIFPVLKAEGHTPLDFYPSFRSEENPLSGFARGYAPPRFSTSYWPLHHRLAMLVETHSWKDYATRVRTTHDVLEATLRAVGDQSPKLTETFHTADERARREIPTQVAVDWKPGPKETRIDFPGYAFTVVKDGVGGPYVAFDTSKKQNWNVPFFSDVVPSATAELPRAGYVVPVAWAARVEPRLQAHGLRYVKIARTETVPAQRFHATSVKLNPRSFEGHQMLTVEGAWRKETREVRAGSLYVPLAQPLQDLAVQLFEPLAQDSLLRWGYFNAAFEQKEYIEDYVLEPWVKTFLAAHPEQRAAYEQKTKSDPSFAKDSAARQRYFAQLHPSWDAELDVYPVMKVDAAP